MYLIINRVYGYVSEKNGVRFLKIDKGGFVLKTYDEVFAGIKHHIKKIGNTDVNYNNDYEKIKFLSDDSLPLDKLIFFPTMTVYLDNCLYQI